MWFLKVLGAEIVRFWSVWHSSRWMVAHDSIIARFRVLDERKEVVYVASTVRPTSTHQKLKRNILWKCFSPSDRPVSFFKRSCAHFHFVGASCTERCGIAALKTEDVKSSKWNDLSLFYPFIVGLLRKRRKIGRERQETGEGSGKVTDSGVTKRKKVGLIIDGSEMKCGHWKEGGERLVNNSPSAWNSHHMSNIRNITYIRPTGIKWKEMVRNQMSHSRIRKNCESINVAHKRRSWWNSKMEISSKSATKQMMAEELWKSVEGLEGDDEITVRWCQDPREA